MKVTWKRGVLGIVAATVAGMTTLVAAGSASAETNECVSRAGGGVMSCVRVELGPGGTGARAHASITDLNDGQNFDIGVSNISLWRETSSGGWEWVRSMDDADNVNPANFDEGRTLYHTCGGYGTDRYFAKAFVWWVPADGFTRRVFQDSPVRIAGCSAG